MWGSFIKAVFKGDFKMSRWSWIAAAFTLIYTLSPIDAVPEALVGPLGFIDDLGLWGVLAAVLRWEMGRYQSKLADTSYTTTATRADDPAA